MGQMAFQTFIAIVVASIRIESVLGMKGVSDWRVFLKNDFNGFVCRKLNIVWLLSITIILNTIKRITYLWIEFVNWLGQYFQFISSENYTSLFEYENYKVL